MADFKKGDKVKIIKVPEGVDNKIKNCEGKIDRHPTEGFDYVYVFGKILFEGGKLPI